MSQLIVDARGRSCPEPVMLARQALAERGGAQLVILVDTPVAKENVSRFLLANAKQQPQVQSKADGGWAILIK